MCFCFRLYRRRGLSVIFWSKREKDFLQFTPELLPLHQANSHHSSNVVLRRRTELDTRLQSRKEGAEEEYAARDGQNKKKVVGEDFASIEPDPVEVSITSTIASLLKLLCARQLKHLPGDSFQAPSPSSMHCDFPDSFPPHSRSLVQVSYPRWQSYAFETVS